MSDPFAAATDAAETLARQTGVVRHDVAVVLGSGWARCADLIAADGRSAEIELAALPGFPVPTAMGHGATLRSIDVAGHRALVFLGRVHLYEGHDAGTIAHAVRTAAAAGCRTIILTNGAGSLRKEWPVGQPVLISDHINLTGCSPLTGPEPRPPHRSRFVDLTDLYTPALHAAARSVDPELPAGVYLGLHGPHFETPAEIRMAATLGADLVGMSTVLEAIAARHVGMDVLGLSLVTNPAAGISGEPIDADDVVAAGVAAADRLGALLHGLLERLDGT